MNVQNFWYMEIKNGEEKAAKRKTRMFSFSVLYTLSMNLDKLNKKPAKFQKSRVFIKVVDFDSEIFVLLMQENW